MAALSTHVQASSLTERALLSSHTVNHPPHSNFKRVSYRDPSTMTSPATPVCYFPRGNIASHHNPCNASIAESWCCNSNDFCLSNGHCLQASESFPNRIGRGSCTDRQWNSAACPFECADGKSPLSLAALKNKHVSIFTCSHEADNNPTPYSSHRPRLRSLSGLRASKRCEPVLLRWAVRQCDGNLREALAGLFEAIPAAARSYCV